MIDTIFFYRDDGNDYPLEAMRLAVLPLPGDLVFLDVCASAWHDFAFAAHFRVVGHVLHTITTRPADREGVHVASHEASITLSSDDPEARTVLKRAWATWK